jgi:hypothetical protein
MPVDLPASAGQPAAAIVTASYAPDFERCRLLCETVDARVSGMEKHYILVAGHDVRQFRALETANRTVVDERDLLPPWLHALRDPVSRFRRHVWLSYKVPPLRGWHVQQLRRMALARHVAEQALVYVDSDVAFVRPFDLSQFWQGDRLRLFRRDGALDAMESGEHREWSANAARALGLPVAASPHDYIATLIAWRRDHTAAMLDHIERTSGRSWVEAVAARRRFSECMLYGRYVDDLRAGEGHVHDPLERCRIYWKGPELGEAELAAFVTGLAPGQVAVGLQSFIGIDLNRIRRLVGVAS